MNTHMTDEEAVDVRALGQRLVELRFPEADDLADRVIRRHRASVGQTAPRGGAANTNRGGRRFRRWQLAPVGAVAALLTAALLVATPAGTALAGSTLATPVVTRLLGIFGLAPATDHVVPLAVSSSSAGQTVQVVAGYADSAATVLVVRVAPSQATPLDATLTDASGTIHQLGGSIPGGQGFTILQFEPISHPVAGRNTLTLHVLRLVDFHAGKGQGGRVPEIGGDWTLHFDLPYEADALAVPAAGRLGKATVTFTGVAVTANSIHVRYVTTGATESELFPFAAPAQAYRFQLIDPKGREVGSFMNSNPAGKGMAGPPEGPAGSEPTRIEWEALYHRTTPGTYRLVMTWNGQRLERDIEVR